MLNHLKAASRELLWAQAAKEHRRINVEVWLPIVQILLRPALKNLVCTENHRKSEGAIAAKMNSIKANISITLMSASPGLSATRATRK
jgi:hypothetical protein